MNLKNQELAGLVALSRAITLNNGRYVDSHDGSEKDLHGIIAYEQPNGHIVFCPFIPCVKAFCLNELEVNGNTIKLSRWSCGGVVTTNDEVTKFRAEHYSGIGRIVEVYELDTDPKVKGEFLLRRINYPTVAA